VNNSAECEVRNAELRSSKKQISFSSFVFSSHFALRTSHSKGFTLLEVMIAVAILSLVIVSLIGLKNRSVQDVVFAEHMTTATLLAKRVMTETLLVKPLVPLEKDGQFDDEEFKDYLWKKTVSLTPIPDAGIYEVRVAVLWKEGEREEMVELVSYE